MAIVIMFRLNGRLAVLVFAPMPALIAMRAAPEQVRRERSLLDRWARICSRFNEVLSGILIVRSFTMEESEKNRFLRDVSEANQLVIRGVATDTGYGAASNFVVAAARLSALAVGGYLAVTHEITVGTVIAFLGYVGALFGPVQGLSGIHQSLSKASVSLEEIVRILGIQGEAASSRRARTRSWCGAAVITPPWCAARTAASSPRSRRVLHRLARGAQTVSQLLELLLDRGVLFIRERELRQQLQRPLVGEGGTVKVPALLLAIAARHGIEMPPHDSHLRLEMLEGPESLHGSSSFIPTWP